MMRKFLSTSAAAHGDTLGVVMNRALKGYNNIEIGIGPRPEPDPGTIIYEMIAKGVIVTAHANCPLGDGRYLNQERDFDEIINRCWDLGIHRYSVHAPRKRDYPSWDEFLTWAVTKWGSTLTPRLREGLSGSITYSYRPRVFEFSVETMYPARDPYWLDSYDEVARFLDWTDHMGWERPLIADVAHLQIGMNQGLWTEPQVEYVMKSQQISEFHYSDNDGIHDNHKPYVEGVNSRIDRWLEWCRETPNIDMVDEGRRRVKT